MEQHTDMKKLLGTFWSFFRIGSFTIGGGLAMLPLIEREFVTRKKWVNAEDMIDILAVSQSVPGVIAINTSIFIGYRLGGFPGSLIAALGVILPSFISILIIAAALVGFQDNLYVQKAFAGVRAGVTALILYAVLKLGKAVITSWMRFSAAAAAFIAIIVLDIDVALVILAAAAAGLLMHAFRSTGRR